MAFEIEDIMFVYYGNQEFMGKDCLYHEFRQLTNKQLEEMINKSDNLWYVTVAKRLLLARNERGIDK